MPEACAVRQCQRRVLGPPRVPLLWTGIDGPTTTRALIAALRVPAGVLLPVRSVVNRKMDGPDLRCPQRASQRTLHVGPLPRARGASN